jgi:hypothetical protein
MRLLSHAKLIVLILIVSIAARVSAVQDLVQTSGSDPFDQRIALVELKNESIFEGIARLNQVSGIAISLEGILPAQGTVINPTFRAKLEGHRIDEILSWFCSLDPRYTWSRDENMANIFPAVYRDDKTYVFNRVLPLLRFDGVSSSDDAALDIFRQLGDPTENIYFLGIGGTQTFAGPWTANFREISVRHALNQIARQLGPTYGWQIGGHIGSRLIMFHYKLGANTGYKPAPES